MFFELNIAKKTVTADQTSAGAKLCITGTTFKTTKSAKTKSTKTGL
ncbi:MAG: hypothetical protein AAGF54_07510 [Pseudomonadota bacterium]